MGTDFYEFESHDFADRNGYRLSQKFREYLSDAGSQIRHPEKSVVTLDDILVSPTLRQERAAGKQSMKEKFAVTWSLDHVLRRRTIVLGSEHSGKTTLCKLAFRDAHAQKLVPVMLNAVRLVKDSESALKKVILEAYEYEYSTLAYSEYEQLSPEQRIIIIDNWDQVGVRSRSAQQALLRLVQNFATRVLLTVKDAYVLAKLDKEEGFGEDLDFDWYRNIPGTKPRRSDPIRDLCCRFSTARLGAKFADVHWQRVSSIAGDPVPNAMPRFARRWILGRL